MNVFQAMYQREKDRPSYPQQFIERVMKVTYKSEPTVRRWLTGREPDELSKQMIAKEFGIPAEQIFAPVKRTKKATTTK